MGFNSGFKGLNHADINMIAEVQSTPEFTEFHMNYLQGIVSTSNIKFNQIRQTDINLDKGQVLKVFRATLWPVNRKIIVKMRFHE